MKTKNTKLVFSRSTKKEEEEEEEEEEKKQQKWGEKSQKNQEK